MKKFFIVLAIILGVGVLIASIGGIVFAVNKDKYAADENFEAKTVVEEAEVKSLSIDIAFGAVEIYPSEDGKLKIEYFEGENTGYIYGFKDGKATFEQKSKKWFWFSLFGKKDKEHYKVNIYLPDTVCDEIDIDLASGSIKSYCDKTDVKIFKADVASGEVSIGNINASESVKIDVASGKVKIFNVKTPKFKGNVSSGNLLIENLTANEADIDISSGEVKITDLTSDKVKAHLSSGTVVLKMTGDLDDYRILGDASSGSVKVKRGSATVISGKDIDYGSGSKEIKVDLSSGSATVQFD